MIYLIGDDPATQVKMSKVYDLIRAGLTGSEKVVVGKDSSSTDKVSIHLFPEEGWRPVLYSGLSAEEISGRVIMDYTFL